MLPPTERHYCFFFLCQGDAERLRFLLSEAVKDEGATPKVLVNNTNILWYLTQIFFACSPEKGREKAEEAKEYCAVACSASSRHCLRYLLLLLF